MQQKVYAFVQMDQRRSVLIAKRNIQKHYPEFHSIHFAKMTQMIGSVDEDWSLQKAHCFLTFNARILKSASC